MDEDLEDLDELEIPFSKGMAMARCMVADLQVSVEELAEALKKMRGKHTMTKNPVFEVRDLSARLLEDVAIIFSMIELTLKDEK